jgi:Ca2+/Na+ antiporter
MDFFDGCDHTRVDISPVVMGITFLTFGNSLSDFLVSVSAVRLGMGSIAVANAFNGSMFNFCIGLGLPYFLATCVFNPGSHVVIDKSAATVPIICMAVALGFVLLITLAGGWKLSLLSGFCLFSLYIGFVVFTVVMEEADS